MDPAEWRFLISGTRPDMVHEDNPDPSWIGTRCWGEICGMSTLPVFDGLATNFIAEHESWRSLFDSSSPETAVFPNRWNKALNSLQKMCILRALRPDKIMNGIQLYVTEHVGERFIQPPVFDLPGTFADSTALSPLIFILTSGCDPGKDL